MASGIPCGGTYRSAGRYSVLLLPPFQCPTAHRNLIVRIKSNRNYAGLGSTRTTSWACRASPIPVGLQAASAVLLVPNVDRDRSPLAAEHSLRQGILLGKVACSPGGCRAGERRVGRRRSRRMRRSGTTRRRGGLAATLVRLATYPALPHHVYMAFRVRTHTGGWCLEIPPITTSCSCMPSTGLRYIHPYTRTRSPTQHTHPHPHTPPPRVPTAIDTAASTKPHGQRHAQPSAHNHYQDKRPHTHPSFGSPADTPNHHRTTS